MHVTSALAVGAGKVLAALFHQGQLILIDRKTGAAETRPGGFILSDTLGHRILLLDDALRMCTEIPFGSQWLQDTILTSAGTYFTLENVHIDQEPQPGLSNHIAEIDRAGTPLGGIQVPPDHRLFAVREIPDDAAQWMIAEWGSSGDLDGWAWN
jgi:hypothetical protein